jgi:hypothetical protein
MRAFPMLLLAIILYNLVAFGGGPTGHPDIAQILAHGATLTVVSGDVWHITLGDGFVLLGFVFLFAEVVKAVANKVRAILNHALSFLTFAFALAEFILLRGFSTSTFFFLTVMTLFDTVAGYAISIVAARRDLHLDEAEPAPHPE